MTTQIDITDALMHALVIAAAILVASLIIARSFAKHAQVMRQSAGDQAFEAAACMRITHETWQGVMEQIAADVLHQHVRVASFTGLTLDRTTCLRFVLHDGRILEFKTASARLGFGGLLDPQRFPRICGELHAACRYFAQGSECAGAVPRDARWSVRVLRAKPAHSPEVSKGKLRHRQGHRQV